MQQHCSTGALFDSPVCEQQAQVASAAVNLHLLLALCVPCVILQDVRVIRKRSFMRMPNTIAVSSRQDYAPAAAAAAASAAAAAGAVAEPEQQLQAGCTCTPRADLLRRASSAFRSSSLPTWPL
jgi:hypothetical protein